MGMEREEEGPGKGRTFGIFSPVSGTNIPSDFQEKESHTTPTSLWGIPFGGVGS